MSKEKDHVEFYNSVADDFEEDYYGDSQDPIIRYDVRQIWKLMSKHINLRDQVLELGCGTGYWLEKISSEFNADCVGIDISPKMISIARERGCEQAFLGDAENLPFQEKTFDTVISPFNTLNHCPNYSEAISEIARVLKPGGKALLMLDNEDRLISKYWDMSDYDYISDLGSNPKKKGVNWDVQVNGDKAEIYTHFFDIEEIKKLFDKYGFQIEIHGINHLPALFQDQLRTLPTEISKNILYCMKKVDNLLQKRLSRYAAHLFVIAEK